MKLLCLYKKHLENKLPYYLKSMFEYISLSEYPTYPNMVKYKNSVRFELPTFLQTAPNELIQKAKTVSYISFKINVKKYIIERYSSLCTIIGCGSCHLRLHIQWFCHLVVQESALSHAYIDPSDRPTHCHIFPPYSSSSIIVLVCFFLITNTNTLR